MPQHRFPLRSMAALVTAPLLLSGCLGPDLPTWYRDVQPTLAANCVSCHKDGGIGPFPLETYEQAKLYAAAIKLSVESGSMPPWMIEPGLPFRNERRLTVEQVELLAKWADEETPLGDPKTAPSDPPQPRADTIRTDARVDMTGRYKPAHSHGHDDYRCFVLDPQLTGAKAVTGFDIKPGNAKVVHHVILYAVGPGHVDELARMDAADEGEGYTCFGAAGVDSTFVGAWVPGTTATKFPKYTGIKLEAGTKIVMQVHYNTLTDAIGDDLTTAELEYAEPQNVTGAVIFPILNDDFSIAPGEVDGVTTEFDTNDFEMPRDMVIKLWGVAPHMHLHGLSIRSELERADGTIVTLFDIPKWDFYWQQLYFYEEPVELLFGDKVRLHCTWDNRSESQPVIAGVRQEPTTLRWGEGTLEEMCLNFFYATY